MLAPSRVLELGAIDKTGALDRLIDATGASDHVSDAEKFRAAILKREEMMSTGVGNGIGVPHVKIPEVRDFVMAVGRSREGIEYGSQDKKPVHLVVLIGANDSQSSQFLTVVANLMTRLKAARFRELVQEAETTEKIHELFVGDFKSR
jgi:mannitol/fructose-specific phosphotransferase system IIA component (Ntr-type)